MTVNLSLTLGIPRRKRIIMEQIPSSLSGSNVSTSWQKESYWKNSQSKRSKNLEVSSFAQLEAQQRWWGELVTWVQSGLGTFCPGYHRLPSSLSSPHWTSPRQFRFHDQQVHRVHYHQKSFGLRQLYNEALHTVYFGSLQMTATTCC